MAKIEDNTKRRSSEMDEQSVTSIPPKKRFLSRASSPDEEDQEENEDAADTFKEPLEAFRKDAIMRQWKDYMRSVKRWKKFIEHVEEDKIKSEESLRLWEDSFKKLQVFLANIIQEGFDSLGHTTIDASLTDEFSDVFKEDMTEIAPNMSVAFKNKDYTDLTVSKLNSLVDTWINKRENITTRFESVFENGSLKEIRRDYNRILSSWVNGQRSVQEMRKRYRTSNFKHLFLSEELRSLNSRLESTESRLRQAQKELKEVESKTTSKSEDVVMSEATNTSVTPENVKPTSSSSMNSPSTTATTSEFNRNYINESGTVHDPLIRAQQILEQKLRDIEMIKEDRIALKQQIARLEMDLISVPESRIYKAPMCRNLSQSRVYHKDKCNHLSDICHDLQNSLDDLSCKRRRLIKELDSEQINHFKGMEAQLVKLDEDLTRIRGERDVLQMSLEEKKASSEAGRASIVELKVIADSRKERVNYLETEVLRLQKKMAARTGCKEYFELLLNSDGREPLLLPFQNEVKVLEEKLENTKQRLYNTIPQKTLDDELAEISKVKQLELEANAFEAKYGFHPSMSTSDAQVQKVLQDRIAKEKQIITEAADKIANLESTEKQLLSEIESVSKAYGDLEEENMAKVKELVEVEDEVLRLQTDRVRYNQAFTALNKSKDAHAMVAGSLTKQSDKQLAHIQQLTERDKNLTKQATCLQREYETSKSIYDIYKQKREEAKITLDELKEKTMFAKDKIAELQTSILDKIRAVEEGAHARLRLEESSELLKRKVDSTNRVDRPAEMKLRKEREEYRSLLNCSSCRTRLKSHVILKCMHTFCKECLESKRRCPSCDEPFSVHDVKQFYF